MPAFMSGADTGKDNIDTDDLIIPRVALMQGISPPVMSGLIPNAHFYHTINEVDLGESLMVVPILHRKQYTLWNPQHAGGGVIARASDGKVWDADFSAEVQIDKNRPKYKVHYEGKRGEPVGREIGLGKWGSADPANEDSGPAATLSHVILMVAPDQIDLGPFIVFLQRSSERVAREFLSKIQIDKAPIFGQRYLMGSRTQQNNAGQEFNQYTFRKDGWLSDEQMFREFEAMHQSFKGQRFRTNDEDAGSEAGASDGAGDDTGGAAADGKGDNY